MPPDNSILYFQSTVFDFSFLIEIVNWNINLTKIVIHIYLNSQFLLGKTQIRAPPVCKCRQKISVQFQWSTSSMCYVLCAMCAVTKKSKKFVYVKYELCILLGCCWTGYAACHGSRRTRKHQSSSRSTIFVCRKKRNVILSFRRLVSDDIK